MLAATVSVVTTSHKETRDARFRGNRKHACARYQQRKAAPLENPPTPVPTGFHPHQIVEIQVYTLLVAKSSITHPYSNYKQRKEWGERLPSACPIFDKKSFRHRKGPTKHNNSSESSRQRKKRYNAQQQQHLRLNHFDDSCMTFEHTPPPPPSLICSWSLYPSCYGLKRQLCPGLYDNSVHATQISPITQ